MADEAVITIRGDDSGATAAFQRVAGSAQQMKGGFDGATSAANGLHGALSNIATTAIGVTTGLAAFAGIGKLFDMGKEALLGFNSQMQNAQIAFETMLGSAQKAQSLLNDLAQFARSTPFEFPDLVSASQKLLAFGFAAQDIVPIMTAVGDATSAMGSVSKESIDRVTLALGQMAAHGRVDAQDMMQLTEAGIPAWQILADAMHKTTAEVMDMSQKGLIPANVAIKDLVEGMENRAPGAMEKMSTTWSGAVSNIKDSLNQLIGGSLHPLFNELEAGANKMADFLMTDQVKEFASQVSGTLMHAFAGFGDLMTGNVAQAQAEFAQLGQMAGAIGNEILLGFLKVADAIAPMVEPVVSMFTELIANAAIWGFNLMATFAEGMVSGAAEVIVAGLNEIGNMIAQFLASFSPPKKGPLSKIDIWGANLINTYLEGMSKADFSALNSIGKSIEDVLNNQVNLHQLDQTQLIPNLVGAQTVLAQIISQFHEFGSASADAFAQLNGYLGDSAGDVDALIQDFVSLGSVDDQIKGVQDAIDALDKQMSGLDDQMRGLDRQIQSLDDQTRGFNRQIQDLDDQTRAIDSSQRHLKEQFDDETGAIQDAIRIWQRYYDDRLKGLDDTNTKLDREIAKLEHINDPNTAALDLEQAKTQQKVDQNKLAEDQNAAAVRRANIEKDIRDVQEQISDEQGKQIKAGDTTAKTSQDHRLRDLNERLSELQSDLATKGVETDDDRLRILQDQNKLVRDGIDIQKAEREPQINALKEQKQQVQDRIDAEKDERDNVLDPFKQKLQDMKDSYDDQNEALEKQKNKIADAKSDLEDQVHAIERQKDAIEDQRHLVEEQKADLEDQKRTLDEQKDTLEKQKSLLQDNIDAVQSRLGYERQISDELHQQEQLLQSLADAGDGAADAAGKKGKLGGAGGGDLKGLGAGALGGVGSLAGIGAGIHTVLDDLPTAFGAKLKDAFDGPTVKAELDQLGQRVKDEFSKSIHDGVIQGLSKVDKGDLAAVGIGAVVGAGIGIWFGGPGGAQLGAIIGAAVGAGIKKGVDESRPVIEQGIANWDWGTFWGGVVKTWAGIFGAVVKSSEIATEIIGAIVYGVSDLAGKGLMELGPAIIGGIGKGLDVAAHDLFGGFIGGVVDELVKAFKAVLRIASPSQLMADEIGGPVIAGLLQGIRDGWDTVASWLAGLPGNILGAVGDLGTTLLDAGTGLLTGLWNGVKGVWDDPVSGWLGGFAGLAADTVGDLSSTLLQHGTALLTGLWHGVENIWNDPISGWLSGFGGTAFTTVGDLTGTLLSTGTDLLTGLWNGVKGVWTDTVQPWLSGFGGKTVDEIGALTRTLWQKGQDLITGLTTGVTNAWDSMLSPWFGKLGSFVVAAAGDIASKVTSIGEGIVKGIWSGIDSLWGGFVDHLTSLVDALPGPVKEALHINSPSLVFKTIGESIMEGLALGIETGQSAVVGAVVGAVNAAVAAGSAAAGLGAPFKAVAGPINGPNPNDPGAGGSGSGGGGNDEKHSGWKPVPDHPGWFEEDVTSDGFTNHMYSYNPAADPTGAGANWKPLGHAAGLDAPDGGFIGRPTALVDMATGQLVGTMSEPGTGGEYIVNQKQMAALMVPAHADGLTADDINRIQRSAGSGPPDDPALQTMAMATAITEYHTWLNKTLDPDVAQRVYLQVMAAPPTPNAGPGGMLNAISMSLFDADAQAAEAFTTAMLKNPDYSYLTEGAGPAAIGGGGAPAPPAAPVAFPGQSFSAPPNGGASPSGWGVPLTGPVAPATGAWGNGGGAFGGGSGNVNLHFHNPQFLHRDQADEVAATLVDALSRALGKRMQMNRVGAF